MAQLWFYAEQVLSTNPTEANKIAKEANQVLFKIGWEMYYKNGEAYFRQINN